MTRAPVLFKRARARVIKVLARMNPFTTTPTSAAVPKTSAALPGPPTTYTRASNDKGVVSGFLFLLPRRSSLLFL